ncbi:MAG: glucosamine-6-phosphate deaminase [Eubacteriales bacterium]|nr:glucosamine-6-phosphate deaminase [Eubacteriales bacterium]
MQILVYNTPQEWATAAAEQVQGVLSSKPRPVLMLPTGSTPIALYAELVRRYQAGELSMAHALSFNLDEYVGLSIDDDQSYHYFMRHHLFDHVDIRPENTHLPDPTLPPDEACRAYNALYDQYGPADIALLGLGHNGHIGFNEPGTPFTNRTAVIPLSASTLEANGRLFGDRTDMPTSALSVGPSMILESRRVLMLVKGQDKASILKTILTHPVTEDIPGTVLQRHPDLVVIADTAAASLL